MDKRKKYDQKQEKIFDYARGEQRTEILDRLKLTRNLLAKAKKYNYDDKFVIIHAFNKNGSMDISVEPGLVAEGIFAFLYMSNYKQIMDKFFTIPEISNLGSNANQAIDNVYKYFHERLITLLDENIAKYSPQKQNANNHAAPVAKVESSILAPFEDYSEFNPKHFAHPDAAAKLAELNERIEVIRGNGNQRILEVMVEKFSKLYDGAKLSDDRFGDIVSMISKTLDLCEGKQLDTATKTVAFNIGKMNSISTLLREFDDIEKDVIKNEIASSTKSVDEVLSSLRQEGLSKEKIITECIFSINNNGGFLADTKTSQKDFGKVPSRLHKTIKLLKEYFNGNDEKEILSIFKKAAASIAYINSETLQETCEFLQSQFDESVINSKEIQHFIKDNASLFENLQIKYNRYVSTKDDLPRQLVKLIIKDNMSQLKINKRKVQKVIDFVGQDKNNLMYELVAGNFSVLGLDLDNIQQRQIPSIKKAIEGFNMTSIEDRLLTTEMLLSSIDAGSSLASNKLLFVSYDDKNKKADVDTIAKQRAQNVKILKSVYNSATVVNMIMSNYAILDMKPNVLTYALNLAAQKDNCYKLTRENFASKISTILQRKSGAQPSAGKTRASHYIAQKDSYSVKVTNVEQLALDKDPSEEEKKALDEILRQNYVSSTAQTDLPPFEDKPAPPKIDYKEKIEQIKNNMLSMLESEKDMKALDGFAETLEDDEKVKLYLFAMFDELYQFSQFEDSSKQKGDYLQNVIQDFAPVLYKEAKAFSQEVANYDEFFTSTRQWLLEKCNSSLENNKASYDESVAVQTNRYDTMIEGAISDSERKTLEDVKNKVLEQLKADSDAQIANARDVIDITVQAERGKLFFENQLSKTSDILSEELHKELKKQYQEVFGETEDKKPLNLTDEEWAEYKDIDEQVDFLNKYVRGKNNDDVSK